MIRRFTRNLIFLDIAGGYLCFVVSILCIGIVTAIIGDIASHFGCTLGIKDSVTAVVFVALGTSIPGIITSRPYCPHGFNKISLFCIYRSKGPNIPRSHGAIITLLCCSGDYAITGTLSIPYRMKWFWYNYSDGNVKISPCDRGLSDKS